MAVVWVWGGAEAVLANQLGVNNKLRADFFGRQKRTPLEFHFRGRVRTEIAHQRWDPCELHRPVFTAAMLAPERISMQYFTLGKELLCMELFERTTLYAKWDNFWCKQILYYPANLVYHPNSINEYKM